MEREKGREKIREKENDDDNNKQQHTFQQSSLRYIPVRMF